MDTVRLDLSRWAVTSSNVPDRANADKSSSHGPSFEKVLGDAVCNVNDLQKDADTMIQKLAIGDVNDISEVVLSVQKAEIALKMLTEVRNKLVDAYQELGRIPV